MVRTMLAALVGLVLAGCGSEAVPAERSDPIDLTTLGYADGSADAPVTVIEFSDFGCPFCAMFARGTYQEIREELIETGRVRWVYIPFTMGSFQNGSEAARASECAGEQERFPEMKTRIYQGQSEWRSVRNATALFAQYAEDVGLDAERFGSCYRENRQGARTRLNNEAARAVGIRATPSFIVNGRLIEGAPPSDQFRALLARLAEEG